MAGIGAETTREDLVDPMRVLVLWVGMEYPNTVEDVRDSYRAENMGEGACTPSISPSCKCGDKNMDNAHCPLPCFAPDSESSLAIFFCRDISWWQGNDVCIPR